jgi:hypothetical protein
VHSQLVTTLPTIGSRTGHVFFFFAANVINIQDASPCISQIPEQFIDIEEGHEQFTEIHEDIDLYLFTDVNNLALIDESEDAQLIP